jgi:hypothetical protein
MAAHGFFGGPAGRPFKIAKTFASINDMKDYFWKK